MIDLVALGFAPRPGETCGGEIDLERVHTSPDVTDGPVLHAVAKIEHRDDGLTLSLP